MSSDDITSANESAILRALMFNKINKKQFSIKLTLHSQEFIFAIHLKVDLGFFK